MDYRFSQDEIVEVQKQTEYLDSVLLAGVRYKIIKAHCSIATDVTRHYLMKLFEHPYTKLKIDRSPINIEAEVLEAIGRKVGYGNNTEPMPRICEEAGPESDVIQRRESSIPDDLRSSGTCKKARKKSGSTESDDRVEEASAENEAPSGGD